MSVFINRGQSDVVDVQVEQSGKSSAEILTEQPLLDSTKDYVMGVTSCVVPLTEEPMMTFDITTSQLFEVRKRKYGTVAGTQVLDPLVFGANGPQTCVLESGYKIFSVTDLVSKLAVWSAVLSSAIAALGLSLDGNGNTLEVNQAIPAGDARIDRTANGNTGTRLLAFSLTAGGTLQVVGSSIFWNNFYLITTPYCRQILGFKDTISVSIVADNINFDESSLLEELFPGVDRIVTQPQQLETGFPAQRVGADYSIFRHTEERMLISVEVALSIPTNLSIVNGTETRTHTVATFPIDTRVVSTISAANGVIKDDVNLAIETHAGRVHLMAKTEGTVQWYPLTSSYAIQNSRVELFMTRRRFAAPQEGGEGKWYTDRKEFKIHNDGVWSSSLKFVSIF